MVVCLITFLFFYGCSDQSPTTLGSDNEYQMVWKPEDKIVAIGTSLTFGFGSGCKVFPLRTDCVADSSYPVLLSEKLYLPIVNLGRPLNTISNALLLVQEVLDHNPVLVFIELGGNEFISGVHINTVRRQLIELISVLRKARISVVVLVAINPDMINYTGISHPLFNRNNDALEYFETLIDVADMFKLPTVPYLLEGVWGEKNLMYDDLHPNGLGYLRMNENILNSLRSFFMFNKLLR